MRRQKRLKTVKIPNLVEGLREHFFKKLLPAILALATLILIIFLAKSFLHTSEYFRLRNIEVSAYANTVMNEAIKGEFLRLYKNKNVFEISLKGIERTLRESYPDSKDISVRISLPDKIIITLKFRKPVALVSDGKLYPIDEEGVVISNSDAASLKDLPIIHGVDIRYGWKTGSKNENKNLKFALVFLREIKKSRLSLNYRLTSIDAGDIKNFSFALNDSFEVRIGCDNLKDRLNLLKKTLRNPRLALDKIKYIDVRFEEAVIGPK